MALGDVTIIATGSIQGDDSKPFARAKSIVKGFSIVADNTERNLIHADVKAGGYLVLNLASGALERWDGASWVTYSSGGGGVTDHGALTGLADDDHAIYTKADGSRAFSGSQSLGNNSLTNVRRIGYGTGPYAGYGSSGAAKTIVAANGDLQQLLLTANCAITVTPGSEACSWTVIYEQDGTGGRTITHAGVTLLGGEAINGTAGSKTIVNYLYDGTTVRVSVVGGLIDTANIANGAVTGPKLAAGSAAGQELVWDGTQWLKLGRKTGALLTNADATLQFNTAAQHIWPAATNTTAIRTLTLGTTGLAAGPNAGVGAIINIFFLRAGYANNILVVNGGAGGGTKFTLPSGLSDPLVASFYYDGTNWELAGWEFLGTVAAA